MAACTQLCPRHARQSRHGRGQRIAGPPMSEPVSRAVEPALLPPTSAERVASWEGMGMNQRQLDSVGRARRDQLHPH